MARRGAVVARVRRAGVDDLAPGFAHWLHELGGGADGRLRLEPSPAERPQGDDDEVALALARMWRDRRPRDIQAAQTLAGPHRDDLWIGAADTDLRRVGSQGEQRTAALALLLAARDHLRARGPRPILLLDDVLSELDPERRRRLLDAVRDGGQTIVTSADPAVTDDLAAPPDAVVRVLEGAHVG
jgi:DNA replication and repair protein RecF